MDDYKAKQQGYTHRAKMYGFIGYYSENENHETFVADYKITNWVVEFLIYVDILFSINDGFPFLLIYRL